MTYSSIEKDFSEETNAPNSSTSNKLSLTRTLYVIPDGMTSHQNVDQTAPRQYVRLDSIFSLINPAHITYCLSCRKGEVDWDFHQDKTPVPRLTHCPICKEPYTWYISIIGRARELIKGEQIITPFGKEVLTFICPDLFASTPDTNRAASILASFFTKGISLWSRYGVDYRLKSFVFIARYARQDAKEILWKSDFGLCQDQLPDLRKKKRAPTKRGFF